MLDRQALRESTLTWTPVLELSASPATFTSDASLSPPDGTPSFKYNANDPNSGNDHRFCAELSRNVFAD